MPTERPRIQAYLDPELHKQFLEWKRDLGIAKDSEAINLLLAEFFGKTNESSIPQSSTMEELRILIQEELWSSGKKDFIDGIKLEAQAMIAKQISETKAYWEELNSLELIKDFRMGLEAKLEALAERLKEVENLLDVKDGHADEIERIEDQLSGELPSKSLELQNLSLTQLAKRLGCNKSMISRHKEREDFEEWSRGRDPDAIAWRYDRKNQRFIPVRK